jgi:hypothetical protein
MVALLLEHGSDPNSIDHDGKTPLMSAVLTGRENIVEMLVTAGADVEYTDPKGDSPRAIAKRWCRNNILKKLDKRSGDSQEDPVTNDSKPFENFSVETPIEFTNKRTLSLDEYVMGILEEEPPPNGDQDFLSLPYAKRQYILVVDDDELEVYLQNSGHEKHGSTLSHMSKVLNKTPLAPYSGSALDTLIISSIPGLGLPYIMYRTIKTYAESKNVYDWVKVSKALGDKDVRNFPVGLEAISKTVRFRPAGHPYYKQIYVGHPLIPHIYYPIGDFHERVFEHKFHEAIAMLAALGAKELKAKHLKGWSKEFSMGLSLPELLTQVASVDAKLEVNSKGSSDMLFQAQFPGNEDPFLPKHLKWIDSEESWRNIANLRLNHNMDHFTLKFQYTNDFGVNAKLATGIEQVGIKIGVEGGYKEFKETIWELEGSF